MKKQWHSSKARDAIVLIGMMMPTLGVSLSGAARDEDEQARVTTASPTLPPAEKAYGAKDAPLTFELFTDYSCRMCRNLFEQSLRPMITDYVVPGKVYLVHHDYPSRTPVRRYSMQAARWATAAAQIGRFGAVEAALYDNRNSWVADGQLKKYVAGAMSAADFQRVQKIMEGCDPPGPSDKADDGVNPSSYPCAVDPYIEHDMLLGKEVPVNATPTFVITYKGQRLFLGSGFVSWPLLKQLLDSLLAKYQ